MKKQVILHGVKNFDIKKIAYSGQCFRINPHPEWLNTYTVVAYGHYLEIFQFPDSDTVEMSCTQEEYETIWKHYFDLETNYQYYIDHVDPSDTYLTAAVAAGEGIRILRQELWEMVVSFMISQNNNISRIKSSIETLCNLYGKGHMTEDGQFWYEFPTPEDIASMTDEEMNDCGFGYRDKYIKKLAENVVSGEINLEMLKDEAMSDTDIETYLKSIYGIGPKVANCIMLFGLHKIDSFPKDTWINKIIKEEYNGKFPVEQYAGFAGVIQQYIFNYVINSTEE